MTIGRPIANTQAYVLDEQIAAGGGGSEWRVVPGRRGIGERLSGASPELTAERFVPDPLQWRSRERGLYRTGDVVR